MLYVHVYCSQGFQLSIPSDYKGEEKGFKIMYKLGVER